MITRGAQKFTYGAGLPAPWNGGANSVSSANAGKSRGSKGNKDKNGVDKEDVDDDEKGDAGGREVVQSAALPDARMFATWDAEKKDYRTPLHMQAGYGRSVRTAGGGGGGVVLSLNRGKRRDSGY